LTLIKVRPIKIFSTDVSKYYGTSIDNEEISNGEINKRIFVGPQIKGMVNDEQ
jgi:hypothetical protein